MFNSIKKTHKRFCLVAGALVVVGCIVTCHLVTNISDSELAKINGGCNLGEICSGTQCDDKPCLWPVQLEHIKVQTFSFGTYIGVSPWKLQIKDCYINTFFGVDPLCLVDGTVSIGFAVWCRW